VTRWLTPDEERAWRGLLQMTAQLQGRLNRQLQDAFGLSLADYDVLVRLTDTPQGRLRVYELAHDLQWEQSRLSHHLARMQRRGLVAREECTTDRRGAFIVLTGTGRRTIEEAAPAHVETVRKLVFDGLPVEHVAVLDSLSAHVLSRLEESVPTP
jgi:DNA-binding MarR family transcriptional regulator